VRAGWCVVYAGRGSKTIAIDRSKTESDTMKMILIACAAMASAGGALAQAPTTHDMAAMPAMDHAAMAAGAQGAGVVKKIDLQAGSITLQHGPIVALHWPAMTMAFKADPALLKTVTVGQKVNFTVKTGGAPEVVAIQPN
jgi:Cu(I)/Ag(I) efflux system protein CusF